MGPHVQSIKIKDIMKHTATAVWKGSVKEGEGNLTTRSKVLDASKYSYNTRFGDGRGTNPDELVAAAHAGCFAMALSLMLGNKGFEPESLEVTATVNMDPAKLELTESRLDLKAKVPGIDRATFEACAQDAKDNCPVSKALAGLTINLKAELL